LTEQGNVPQSLVSEQSTWAAKVQKKKSEQKEKGTKNGLPGESYNKHIHVVRPPPPPRGACSFRYFKNLKKIKN
jgi:hypothetical protein